MKIFGRIKILLFISFLLISFGLHAEKKVALIIGNKSYPAEEYDDLRTCINDANLINKVLTSLGYETIVVTDCNQSDFTAAFAKFNNLSKNSDIAILFYSGHAKNIGGEFYMVPSKTMTFTQTAQRSQLVPLVDILEIMTKNSNLSLLFMDACRDGVHMKPFASGISKGERKTPKGKFSNSQPFGWMIFYATQYGKTATIGDGTVSPFTSVLAKHLTDGDEFMTVWSNIQAEVPAIAPGQFPDQENFYQQNLYLNPLGDKMTSPETDPITEQSKYKNIAINCNIPNARVNIYGSTFDTGKPIPFEKDREYTYTIEIPGYQKYTGIINVNKSPSSIDVNLVKLEPAVLFVSANTNADVYFDNKFVGQCKPNSALLIETLSGEHNIRLSANGYYNSYETFNLEPGRSAKDYTLVKDYPKYWEWDEDNINNSVGYFFSPKYQIGLSYMHRFEYSRWSIGGIIAVSPEWLYYKIGGKIKV